MAGARQLVGRTAEVAVLAERCADIRAPLAAVAIEGPAGIGKTSVWEATAPLAAGAGRRVLACRAARTEAGLAFTGLGDLLAPVRASLDGLPAPQARALRVALLLEDPGPRPVDPRALGLGLVGLLGALGPLALLIDDLQWLDGASAAALAFALRRLGGAPVLLVATVRREDPATAHPGLLAAIDPRALRVIELGPLRGIALHQLLREAVGRPLPRALLGRIEDLSGGNPLYAVTLARAAGAADELPASLAGTLRELVADRVGDLPATAREAVAVVAAVPEARAALVSQVVGDPDALGTAEAAGAVVVEDGRVRLAHPLLAAAVEALPAAGRRDLHRRLAGAVADPVARAGHLGLAAVPPDPDVAAELEAAAAVAGSRGAPLAAAELLERALELLPRGDVGRRAGAAVAGARLHYIGGDERRGRRLLQQAREELPAGPERADVLLCLAELEDQSVEHMLALTGEALAEAGSDLARRARVLITRSELHGVRLEFEAAADCAREAAGLAARAGSRSVEADALSHVANLVAPLASQDPVPLWERAVVLADDESGLDSWWRPRFSLDRWRSYADDLDAAAHALEARRKAAGARGDDHERHAVCLHLAELECRRGNLEAAARYADEGHDLTEQLGADLSRASLVYAQALVAAHGGDAPRVRALAREGLELCARLDFRWMALQLRHVLGLTALGAGDHAAAAAQLVPLMKDFEAARLWDPGMIPAHADGIEAAVGTGLLDEAAAWLATYEEVGRRLDRPRAIACGGRCRGLLHAARGDLPSALAALEAALAEHDRLPVPLERARTLLALGTVQRRMKQRGLARRSLEAAAGAFDAVGAVAWAARARAELARIGGRGHRTEGLTPTEARVAALVAEGRSNKEAAAALFVSVRAVEANLSRVYAKLGVRSRTELAGRLARGNGPD